jgi:hypothetical protein
MLSIRRHCIAVADARHVNRDQHLVGYFHNNFAVSFLVTPGLSACRNAV